ncbi:Pimeloyl-ACP methyl ester carboxylesterase [Parafrankia irregularis]|uniref:Pimeloyl-ACP methyl ester carboxylesterase n=1 Tax=Parafrankia irregularis TaxID=795642 RepID=A0A0S4QGA2_9ACTN|nr:MULTISPECIES: alpha/beta hydrolase [Parafrankia]MBE3201021.1 alpha/beta hydrolase [Parafrankia sp. CH37]CUU54581.1 Pimeloyl-ACP methyl ester carboxylesterase [Parafrankia irregularis]
MAKAIVNGLGIGYDLVGDGDRTWVLTLGGRFTRRTPGVPELAAALATPGNRVLLWDRPNSGESDLCFAGGSEPRMQADTLAALLTELDLGPAVLAGATVGSHVSLLTAAYHPQVAAGLAVWWVSGGVPGLTILANAYYTASVTAAWTTGMEAVAALPEWGPSFAANARNRQRLLAQDRAEFVATLQRWMAAFSARPGEVIPGLPDDVARSVRVPALVLRSGASDPFHPRAVSEALAAALPQARLAEPPWGDREYLERQADMARAGSLFVRWPLLAPVLTSWAADTLT